jgi:hypothetical protein
MKDFQRNVTKGDQVPFLQITVGRRRIVNLYSPCPSASPLMQDHGSIRTVDEKLSLCHFFKALILRRMVKMTMGIDDVKAAKIVLGVGDQDFVRIASRVDDSGLSCPLTAQDVTVCLNRSDH